MATPSSILAWKIPWMEERGGESLVAGENTAGKDTTGAGGEKARHSWYKETRSHGATHWFEEFDLSKGCEVFN